MIACPPRSGGKWHVCARNDEGAHGGGPGAPSAGCPRTSVAGSFTGQNPDHRVVGGPLRGGVLHGHCGVRTPRARLPGHPPGLESGIPPRGRWRHALRSSRKPSVSPWRVPPRHGRPDPAGPWNGPSTATSTASSMRCRRVPVIADPSASTRSKRS